MDFSGWVKHEQKECIAFKENSPFKCLHGMYSPVNRIIKGFRLAILNQIKFQIGIGLFDPIEWLHEASLSDRPVNRIKHGTNGWDTNLAHTHKTMGPY